MLQCRHGSLIEKTAAWALFYGMNVRSAVTFLLNLNPIPFDLLVECGERNVKTIRGFGLTPRAAFEHLDNNSFLDRIHDVKE